MSESDVRQIFIQHREGQDKYAYFLLAAAASALAFAVQKTDGLTVSWEMFPLGCATILWLVSFYCGCRHIVWTQAAVGANYAMLQLREGTHPKQPPDMQLTQAAIKGVLSALDSNAAKAERFAALQFNCLCFGGLAFISWRVLQMIMHC